MDALTNDTSLGIVVAVSGGAILAITALIIAYLRARGQGRKD